MSSPLLLAPAPASPIGPPSPDGEARCPTCGADRPRRHCPECGEARVAPDELTLRHFAGQAAEQLTSVDGTLWRTLRTLLLRPGVLTVEYFAGRRRPYAKPLQLFLLTNVAVLLFLQLAGVDLGASRRTLAAYQDGRVRTGIAFKDAARVRRVVEARRARTGLTPPAFAARFDARRQGMGQTAWLLAVPVLAGALSLLYARRRAPFLRHLVCAIHLAAFLSAGALLFSITATALALAVRGAAHHVALVDRGLDLLGVVGAGWVAVYLFRALRRVYPERWGWTLARTAVLFAILPVMAVALLNDVAFLLALLAT